MSAKYGYVGNSPDTTPIRIARRTYTLTGVQTSFTFDAGYSVGYVDVYLNGVKQIENDDFIASNGSTVGFTSAPTTGDIVEIVAYKAYDVIQDRNNVAGDFTVYGNSTLSGTLFVNNNSKNVMVGTGVTITSNTINVTGVVTATNINVTSNINTTGVITATSYFGSGANLTGIALSATANINTSGVGTFGRVVGTNDLDIPNGTTAQRFATPVAGSIRYNSEYDVLEIYTGSQWKALFLQSYTSSPSDTGIFAGGSNPGNRTIEYITISSTGNGTNFGTLSYDRWAGGGCSSTTRGLFGGGVPAPNTNNIEYINIQFLGDALNFGALTTIGSASGVAACSNSTRGVFGGGQVSTVTTSSIQYVTIASKSDSTSFGTLTLGRRLLTSCSSSTRGIFAGGDSLAPLTPAPNTIDYITIASTGNAIDFGDLTAGRTYLSACSSSTRGVFGGGFGPSNIIDYITIASTGNATSFGQLTVARGGLAATSNATRGVFGGGDTPVAVNTIDYITIASTGNATSFGQLSVIRTNLQSCSTSHGGLQ
jgi:hypothetical protein